MVFGPFRLGAWQFRLEKKTKIGRQKNAFSAM